MPLKMRPSGLNSGLDKDRPDYIVCSGQLDIGRIYQTRSGPENIRWFWSMTVNGPMTRADSVPTLEEARLEFRGADKCLEGLGEAGRGGIGSGANSVGSGERRRREMMNHAFTEEQIERAADAIDAEREKITREFCEGVHRNAVKSKNEPYVQCWPLGREYSRRCAIAALNSLNDALM